MNLVRDPFEQAELYFTATPETASQCAAQIILHSASFVLHLLALWASLNLVAIIVYVLCFKKPASVQLLVEDCPCKSCDVHRLRQVNRAKLGRMMNAYQRQLRQERLEPQEN